MRTQHKPGGSFSLASAPALAPSYSQHPLLPCPPPRAAGSMVAPSVPCTLVTPLAPHSLSFRPLIIPEGSLVTVRVPPFARSHARCGPGAGFGGLGL